MRGAPVDDAVADPLGPADPREIGRFTILGVLGSGGMGEVYLGTCEGRYVAVKRVRPRLVSTERFNREVAILHRVPRGVAPAVLASDSTAAEPWFATDYLPGLTVDEAVRTHGPLPADALWLLLAEVAAHLDTVHAAGIVHRDLKPVNIMLVRDGVKLIDFGIALAADQSRLTRNGASSGTRGFSAPEQDAGRREATSAADVYSLGATLAYAASARLPGLTPDLRPLRTVDAELAEVVESCLAAAEQRPTASDLAAEAHRHLGDEAPTWPSVVMARIETRRSFAATPVAKLETVLPPEPDSTEQPPEPPPTSGPSESGKRRVVLPLAAATTFCAVVAGVLALWPTVFLKGSTPGPAVASVSASQASPALVTGPTSPSVPAKPTTVPTSSAKPAGSSTSRSVTSAATTTKSAPSPTSSPGTNTTTSSSAVTQKPTPSPSASSIPAVDGTADPDRVPGSEVDVTMIVNDAGCSAWLDSDGAGNLAGVLNTSLYQTCAARLVRSDGMDFTFQQSQHAKKTNYISDIGFTMRICVWNVSDPGTVRCSPNFGMNGTSPVAK